MKTAVRLLTPRTLGRCSRLAPKTTSIIFSFFFSGWYFNAGEFHMPVSGFTHIKTEKNVTEWSGYRFHEMDPLRFQDGFKLQWRCGDLSGPAPNGGGKCYTDVGGHPVGTRTPTCDNVKSYGWVYVWPNSNPAAARTAA